MIARIWKSGDYESDRDEVRAHGVREEEMKREVLQKEERTWKEGNLQRGDRESV